MNDKPPIPRVTPTEKEFHGELSPAIAKEKCWIQHSVHLLSTYQLQKGQQYHASLQPISVDPCVIAALLPLFMEKADSPAIHYQLFTVRKCVPYYPDTPCSSSYSHGSIQTPRRCLCFSRSARGVTR